MLLYTKYEHGLLPVEVVEEKNKKFYKIHDKIFVTFSDFLKYVYNTDKVLKISFNRYFKANKVEQENTILEMFGPPQGVNIDLKFNDIKKILYKKFGKYILSNGFNFEDILQEVYMGIVRKNNSRSSWNENRGKFGSYIHLVCRSIISNYKSKHAKFYVKEVLGVKQYIKGGESYEDSNVSDLNSNKTDHYIKEDSREEDLIEDFRKYISSLDCDNEKVKETAIRIVPLMYKGYKKYEIAKEPGLSYNNVCRAITFIKNNSKDYFANR